VGGVGAAHAEERARLARELHDGLTQDLGALRLLLKTGRIRTRDEGARAVLEEAAARVSELVEEVRGVSHTLHPVVSELGGLRRALERLAADAERGGGVVVVVELEEGLALPVGVEAQLYRMAQEALQNAVRHGRAGRVVVTVEGVGERAVRLRVVDDGVGFDVRRAEARAGEAGGLGLRTVRERATLLGGWARVWSRVGEGTRVEVEVPL